ncbi:MAG: hypothetical protein VKP62_04290 [Candidatus Sericytochromatia bacterium]|nr:hypothetical protein [Candidatus Sericytochromatia bacterium]
MRIDALAVTSLLGLAGIQAALPPAVAQTSPEALSVRFDARQGILWLRLPAGVEPHMRELAGPPRLVLEWRGTPEVGSRVESYAEGLASGLAIETTGLATRATLTLREATGGRLKVDVLPQGWRIILDPRWMVRHADHPAYAPRVPLGRTTPPPVAAAVPERFRRQALTWPLVPLAPGHEREPDNPRALRTPPPLDGPPPPPEPTPLPVSRQLRSPPPDMYGYPQADPPVRRRASRVRVPRPSPTPLPVFASRLLVGPDVLVGYQETYPIGRSQTRVPVALGGSLLWEHLLGDTVGLSLGARTWGTVIDDARVGREFSVRHQRDESELVAGLRGRWVLWPGIEGLLQTALVTRATNALTRQARVTGGRGDAPIVVDTTDYMSSNWLAFGGELRAGLGWRVWGPLAWTAWGDYRILPSGQLLTPGVPSFFPLVGLRGGSELRLDWQAWALAAGGAYALDGTVGQSPARTLTQASTTFYLRGGWRY